MTQNCTPPNPHHFSWQQTMLRVKDPEKSLHFYCDLLGMTLIHKQVFVDMNFSLYFLVSLPEGEVCPTPGTPESTAYLWNLKGTCLELTHNHGTEKQENFKYHNGNVEPRGFGHVAFLTDDVYVSCEELEKNGVCFQKKPDEGRMKGLAFALDPDGYWVEIIKRNPDSGIKLKYNLAQTMIRIKDPKKTIPFYRDNFGMSLIGEKHFPEAKFSLYFMASVSEGTQLPSPQSAEANNSMKSRFDPVLELTHNHGTEEQQDPVYHNGNSEPRGFGHIGFLCDDVYKVCAELEQKGVQFQKTPDGGKMKGLAFVLDPDNYWVEIIKRGWMPQF